MGLVIKMMAKLGVVAGAGVLLYGYITNRNDMKLIGGGLVVLIIAADYYYKYIIIPRNIRAHSGWTE